jgi:hemolysin activation/secretion protein
MALKPAANNNTLIKTISYIFFCCVVTDVFPSIALAQIIPDAGSVLREMERPIPQLPRPAPPLIRIEEPSRPALKPSAVTPFMLKTLRISGNTVFIQADLLALVQDFVGKEVGYADLDAAAARISRYYRERGYRVARAYLPAQEIKDGVVEIAVIEGAAAGSK